VNIDQKNLPANWAWSTMGEIAEVIGGGTPKTKDPTNFEGGSIPWLTPADLSGYTGKTIGKGARCITQNGLDTSSAKLMPAGTILFTSRAPIGYVVIAANEISTNQGFKSFTLKSEKILPDYVYWWLKGNKDLAESYASGTTFLELSGSKAKQLPIPVAPLEQQKRIVAEIEKQFSRLDEAVANLKRVKANLKRYKAAVLKAAVEGNLTEKWREDHPDVEPASKLLERILAERRQKWEEAELAKMKAKGKLPKNDKWKKKYKEPNPLTTRIDLQQLPVSWAWVTVDQIGAVGEQPVLTGPFGSNLGKSDFKPSGVPVLTIGCLQEEGILLNKAVFITEKKAQELAKYKLTKGDMLFSRMAAVGRAGFITEEFEGAIFNYHIMRLSLAEEAIDPSYYLSYVRGARSVTDYVREVNHGATRDGINTDQLLSMPVALPPNEEQDQIIREVESRLSVVHQIDNEVDLNLKRATRLQQSILSKAFSGELTIYDKKGMENKCPTCQ